MWLFYTLQKRVKYLAMMICKKKQKPHQKIMLCFCKLNSTRKSKSCEVLANLWEMDYLNKHSNFNSDNENKSTSQSLVCQLLFLTLTVIIIISNINSAFNYDLGIPLSTL